MPSWGYCCKKPIRSTIPEGNAISTATGAATLASETGRNRGLAAPTLLHGTVRPRRRALAGLLIAPLDFTTPSVKRRFRQLLPLTELADRKSAGLVPPQGSPPKPLLNQIAPRTALGQGNSSLCRWGSIRFRLPSPSRCGWWNAYAKGAL